jgi:glycosyltransferase involved in cell wall biosynthesis
MYQGYKLGIVVPAYNEERLIGDTLNNMPEYADRIYVVNDIIYHKSYSYIM